MLQSMETNKKTSETDKKIKDAVDQATKASEVVEGTVSTQEVFKSELKRMAQALTPFEVKPGQSRAEHDLFYRMNSIIAMIKLIANHI